MCNNAKLFRPLLNNDMNQVPRGFIKYDEECLSYEEKEELEGVFVDLSKANEHYLATHKQALGLISFILHNVIRDQPFEPKKYIKNLLKSNDLKYELNKHMVEKGYVKNKSQLEHDAKYKGKVNRVHKRILKEKTGEVNKYLDHGKITLTSYGPPFPACKIPFAKSEISTILHGLIPTYDKPQRIIHPADDPQRDLEEWPTLYS